MKLKTRIILIFGVFIFFVISGIMIINLKLVKDSVHDIARNEMQNIMNTAFQSTNSILNSAIRNYLRGMSEKSLEIVEKYYKDFKQGRFSEREAKRRAAHMLNRFKIAETGYIVVVGIRARSLYLDIHPFLQGQDCTNETGCQVWANTPRGYAEYDWRNPKDNQYRKKVSYNSYFKPWSWVIGATSYRDEFTKLVDIKDLKRLLKPLRILKSGYFYVFDDKYNILIHPELEGQNGKDFEDNQGKKINQIIAKQKKGWLNYTWQNPSEKSFKEKYAYFEYLPDFKWYFVATGYVSDQEKPVKQIKFSGGMFIVIAGAVLFLIVILFTKNITGPVEKIVLAIKSFNQNKKAVILQSVHIQELEILVQAFNQMSRELEKTLGELEEKILALKTSEHRLEQTHVFLDTIIHTMPSAIITVNEKLEITLFNEAAKSIMEQDALRENKSDLLKAVPFLKNYQNELQQTVFQGKKFEQSRAILGGQKSKKVLNLSFYPLVLADFQGAVLRLDDVTEQQRFEEMVMQSEKMATVGGLAAGMAHEINNPIGIIVASVQNIKRRFSELLESNLKAAEVLGLSLDEMQRYLKERKIYFYLDGIQEAGERAAEIVKNMLQFSKKGDLVKYSCDLHSLLQNVLYLLQKDEDILELVPMENLAIHTDFKAEPAEIDGLKSELEQVFFNILKNSFQAISQTQSRTPEICLSTVRKENGVLVEIKDNGPGMSEAVKKRVFDPFFTTREVGAGKGLGLAVAYFIVTVRHNGKIEVETVPGEYTIFKVFLPA